MPARLWTMVLGAALALVGYWGATHYVPRLSHHAGYALVPVDDHVMVPRRSRPRHTAVVVVDGLRFDAALGMRSVTRVRERGQCLRTWVGLPSVSRPVYAELSTGLEQDRTGARNNDETSPLAAESLWEVARAAGLRVEGRSELAWWRELFPRGFDPYVVVPEESNAFPHALDADLTLVHPTYVDEKSHLFGAKSPEVTGAVQRVDAEIGALLDQTDLTRDLVVLTADHGHRDRGGHGGPQPEVAYVLTCFGGNGVVRRSELGTFQTKAIAPSLAVLLGLRFPRHMRAGEDDLDAVFGIAEARLEDAPFFADRRAAVERYREANATALRAWSGGTIDRWSAWYEAGSRGQILRGLGVVLFGGLVVGWILFRAGRTRALVALGHTLAFSLVYVAAYALLAGGLDATSLNRRPEFAKNVLSAIAVALVVASLAHRLLPERARARELGALVLAIVAVTTNAAHLAAYGWPLGFPIPPPLLYFAPFLTNVLLLGAGLDLVLANLPQFVWPKRSSGRVAERPQP